MGGEQLSEPTKTTTGRPSKQRILPDRYRDNRLWAIRNGIAEAPFCAAIVLFALKLCSQPPHGLLDAGWLGELALSVGESIIPLLCCASILAFLLVPYVVCLFARRPVVLPCPHCGAKPEIKGWFFNWHCPNPQCPGYDRTGGWETRKDWNRYAGVVREFLDAGRKCACCGKTISINVGLRDGNACYVASCACATGMGGRIESALDDRANRARRSVSDEDAKRRKQSVAVAQRRRMEGYVDVLNRVER